MSKEIWIEIPGYENYYEISSKRNIRTKSKTIYDNDGNVLSVINSSPVQIKSSKDSGEKYVLLRTQSKYKKEFLKDLMHISFNK